MYSNIKLTTLALLVSLAACDKGSDSSNPPQTGEDAAGAAAGATDTATVAATEPGAPNIPWADKTPQQRQEFMGIYVLPKMKTLFKEYDEANYKSFKCQTCHGDDMKATNFKMPTESIYALSKENPIQSAMEYDEKVTKFMMEKVVPEMATLLGEQPYNPETGQGFGCMGCHTVE